MKNATLPARPSDRLPAADAGFLYCERPDAPLHIGSVSVFDGPIQFQRCRAHILSKLPLIPRYKQRLVVPPFNMGHPTWEFDPEFDITRHVHHSHLEHGTEAELRSMAANLFSQIMDRNRPLWDVTVVDGLERGRTALITRVHHCLVDGVSGVAILNVLLDPAPAPHKAAVPVGPLPSAGGSLLDAVFSTPPDTVQQILSAERETWDVVQDLLSRHALSAWRSVGCALPELLSPVDPLPFNKPCSGGRKLAWTSMPIADIQAIRKTYGGTLNDVVLATLTGAVRRYAQLHGEPIRGRSLRVMVPVSLRCGDAGGLGNRVSLIPVSIPLDLLDAAKLLDWVSVRTESLKSAHVADLIGLGASWMGVVPAPLQALLGAFASRAPLAPFHLVCTNVPGPRGPVELLGREMLTYHPYVPIGLEMGLNCAVVSYNGNIYFGLTGDSEAVPDMDCLREFLDQSFAELCGPGTSESPGSRQVDRKGHRNAAHAAA